MDASSLLSSALGIRLTLWLGKVAAVPAPVFVVEALSEASVTLSDEGRDGFQLTFTVGRAGVGMLDNLLVASPLLIPSNRVILQIWFGVFPEILIDGIITQQEFHASGEPGGSTLTITGEDIRVLMDMDENAMPFPNMPPHVRIQLLLAKYFAYLATPPITMPALVPETYLMTDRIPVQSCTDFEYINNLAKKNNYVFYVEPQAPLVSLAYWGPDKSLPVPPQPALSVNMGPDSNVDSIHFSNDALSPRMVSGFIQDKMTGLPVPVASLPMARIPLTPLPAAITQQPFVRRVFPKHSSSIDPIEALLKAQAITNKANDAITATGELDAVRYGHVLKPRRFVGVRGAGLLQDGMYYVKQVKHSIKHGEYKQSFTLKRDGRGPLTPVVLP
ncbi:MAG: hypothetical protein PHO08_08290 [Methylococcales bacterium]|nr:hypothetical protein [Methylococcales bacterium]